MEKTTGAYRLTQVSVIYDFYQKALGSHRARKTIVSNHIRPKENDLVLDLGCGSAEVLPYLGKVNYVGIDRNQGHIDNAKSQFSDQGIFHCGDFSDAKNFSKEGYNLILCLGLLHHLIDKEAQELAALAKSLLLPGGCLIAVDPAFIKNQNPIAKKLAQWDSGQNVRTPEQYCSLLSNSFSVVNFKVYNNLLRVPYTHCITTSQNQG